MNVKDLRIKLMNEILNGIKVRAGTWCGRTYCKIIYSFLN